MNQVLLYNVNRQSVIQLIAHKIQIIHLLHEHVPTKCWLVHIGLQELKKKKKKPMTASKFTNYEQTSSNNSYLHALN